MLLQDKLTSANEFFKAVFGSIQLNQTLIDSTIEFMNNTIMIILQLAMVPLILIAIIILYVVIIRI